jgi:epoxyqueuosine reductase
MTLTEKVKAAALQLGFQAVGIASADALQSRRETLIRWITSGYAGRMGYMEQFLERQARFLERLPDLKSIVVAAAGYGKKGQAVKDARPRGRIARYAAGRDYHRVIGKRLKRLESIIRSQVGPEARFIRCVDTGPVQERVLAEQAGLGFFGKNTLLILPKGGSFVFLAALLTNLELTPDKPIRRDCGSCTLCLEACPTQALTEAYRLDARRCISYLTIELREAIDPGLRPQMGDWIFGCDICQEVCPYNHSKGEPPWPEFGPENGAGVSLPLEEILRIQTDEEFSARFAGTPLMRAKREGLLRNAAIAAGNSRQHVASALEKISTPV